jgi:hypothetical protein
VGCTAAVKYPERGQSVVCKNARVLCPEARVLDRRCDRMRKIVVSFPEHAPNGNFEQGERREEEETPSVIPACNEQKMQRPSRVRSKMQVERQEIQMQERVGASDTRTTVKRGDVNRCVDKSSSRHGRGRNGLTDAGDPCLMLHSRTLHSSFMLRLAVLGICCGHESYLALGLYHASHGQFGHHVQDHTAWTLIKR